jgi:hypothetical protein
MEKVTGCRDDDDGDREAHAQKVKCQRLKQTMTLN